MQVEILIRKGTISAESERDAVERGLKVVRGISTLFIEGDLEVAAQFVRDGVGQLGLSSDEAIAELRAKLVGKS